MSEVQTTSDTPQPIKKHKILVLSDHPLATSGVGVQARFLIEGLIRTGKYSFRCLGGAIKHPDYNTIKVNDDFIIKPVDGFGTKEMLRHLLATERPDALFLFTDPRQFIWVWEMEEEIHQICPIVYWHVWDNDPYPAFNSVLYESTDLINCLSYKTYQIVKPNFPDKTHYIPHAFPKDIYYTMPKDKVSQLRAQHFGDKKDWFYALWVNRNATRKVPSDVLESWKMFLDMLKEREGHQNAVLIMHTDPNDQEGPNLFMVSEMLGISPNVWFSPNRIGFEEMNVMHNITDVCVNIAKNEGFGLSTLISMQCGKPIIALKTGGMTRQVVDHRSGVENGVALEPSKRILVGSQLVPYIYEDFADQKETAEAFYKIYKMTDSEKESLAKQMADYLDYEFNYEKVVQAWDETMDNCITNFKTNPPKKWELNPIDPKTVTGTIPNLPQAPAVPVAMPRQNRVSLPIPVKKPIDISALIKEKTVKR
jgi:glycosyltransferase involved in cell wall biosynthesis